MDFKSIHCVSILFWGKNLLDENYSVKLRFGAALRRIREETGLERDFGDVGSTIWLQDNLLPTANLIKPELVCKFRL